MATIFSDHHFEASGVTTITIPAASQTASRSGFLHLAVVDRDENTQQMQFKVSTNTSNGYNDIYNVTTQSSQSLSFPFRTAATPSDIVFTIQRVNGNGEWSGTILAEMSDVADS